MLRRNGVLVPIGWDEALDLAAEKLLKIREESGPAAILHYKSGGSLGILKSLAHLLFERFGPVSIKRGDICSGAGDAAQAKDFGVADGHDMFDLAHSRTILIWGKNVHASSVHLLPVLRDAKAKGGMLRDGQCANLLVAAVESDDGGGAAYYDELVRLRTAEA